METNATGGIHLLVFISRKEIAQKAKIASSCTLEELPQPVAVPQVLQNLRSRKRKKKLKLKLLRKLRR